MRTRDVELVVIGAGPAGLAAALTANEEGIEDIVLIERDLEPGGILQQCIHNGFGVHYFGEELTGPEYAQRFIDMIGGTGVEIKTDTMALEITPDKEVYTVSSEEGMTCFKAKGVVLAMGCRERTREAIAIPGSRPAGILTAGTAQRYINMEGYLPGEKVMILGSGDIGLIMARRLTLEGAQVEGVLEIMDYSNGLQRNVVQCLDDFDIPLYLKHTVIRIHGDYRLEGVTIAKVDDDFNPIPGTEEYVEVDTLLLSVGLIPENELSRSAGVELSQRTAGPLVTQDCQTQVPGIFACGNVLHVHDLVDYVTEEAQLAGRSAARYIQGKDDKEGQRVGIEAGPGVTYVVPQMIDLPVAESLHFYLRVNRLMDRGRVIIRSGDEIIYQQKERFLRPAEMQKIELEGDVIKRIKLAQGLSIDIKEGWQ